MSDRLTDEEMDSLEHARGMTESEYEPTCRRKPYSDCPGATDDTITFWQKAHEMVPKMLAELRARRAQDPDSAAVLGEDDGTIRRVYLTAQDREALEWAAGELRGDLEHGHVTARRWIANADRALSVLDRLIGGKP